MPRPRKSHVDEICDRFSDLSLAQQDGLLLTLTALHRQAKRQAERVDHRPNLIPDDMVQTDVELAGESDIERARRMA